jgi:hypothetical protein
VGLPDIVVRSVRPEEHEAVGDLCVAAYDAIGLASEHYVQTLRDTAARVAGADVLVAVARDDGNRSPVRTRWPLGTVTLITDFGPYGEIARAGGGGVPPAGHRPRGAGPRGRRGPRARVRRALGRRSAAGCSCARAGRTWRPPTASTAAWASADARARLVAPARRAARDLRARARPGVTVL